MGKFEDLKVWQKGINLSVDIYGLTSHGNLSKDFGLIDQMRRSSVSIPSNIAEGDELNTQKQSINHFYIAKGSCAELFTQIIIASRVGYINDEKSKRFLNECKTISSMLQKLINVRSSTL